MRGAGLGMRVAASAAMATSRSVSSRARSSKRSCETRMPLMLRTRSPRKSATWRINSSNNLPAALEVQVAAHREDALVAVLLHDVERGRAAKAPVRRAHPAIGEAAVMGKQNAQ